MRIRAIVIRILRQFFHDKRTLMMMLVAPMLILFMMSLVFNGSTYVPKLGAVMSLPHSFRNCKKAAQKSRSTRRRKPKRNLRTSNWTVYSK